ncbi:MAG TPA: sigma-70 family RNA polymerase sigma factor [Candidatus Acidoferrales bacterium]|nr:sigma-70 family RNA polymerase sigma factor [Candidatus Acidoferrales bacterium]
MARGASALKASGVEPDERSIIEAAQRDPSRFADLYEMNFERVYAYIARRVGDRATTQDLTADVFHQALANLQRFEWRGVPFVAWLLRIAANAVADHLSKTARTAIEPDRPEALSAEEVQYRARLFHLVNELPEDQQRVIRMRFAEQRSIRDIADALGRSEGAVKQLQWRGLQGLRSRVGERNG